MLVVRVYLDTNETILTDGRHLSIHPPTQPTYLPTAGRALRDPLLPAQVPHSLLPGPSRPIDARIIPVHWDPSVSQPYGRATVRLSHVYPSVSIDHGRSRAARGGTGRWRTASCTTPSRRVHNTHIHSCLCCAPPPERRNGVGHRLTTTLPNENTREQIHQDKNVLENMIRKGRDGGGYR